MIGRRHSRYAIAEGMTEQHGRTIAELTEAERHIIGKIVQADASHRSCRPGDPTRLGAKDPPTAFNHVCNEAS